MQGKELEEALKHDRARRENLEAMAKGVVANLQESRFDAAAQLLAALRTNLTGAPQEKFTTAQLENHLGTVSKQLATGLMASCCQLVPALQKATVELHNAMTSESSKLEDKHLSAELLERCIELVERSFNVAQRINRLADGALVLGHVKDVMAPTVTAGYANAPAASHMGTCTLCAGQLWRNEETGGIHGHAGACDGTKAI